MAQSLSVAIYARVSTSDKGQNPEVQIAELRRYCTARGWVIEHEIVDHGYSGTTGDRPGLKKLLKLVSSRQVDVVVMLKLDRLFRSLKHLVTTLDEWQALGIQFVATKDSIDYTTPGGRLFAQILGSLAEFEKSLLVERTKLGLEHARRQGKILGRPRLQNENEIVRMRADGMKQSEIVLKLGVSKGAVYRALKKA